MENKEQLIYKVLKEYFGFDNFKGLQKEVILSLLEGKDVFVLMPTGGGKSLCFQLPALILDGVAVVISPLIALMKNQVDSMRGFSTEEGVAHFLNSSLTKTEINKVKEDILKGKTKLLYVAPESLTKEENVEFLRKIKISFYAIDEAHCISEWGHDFRPEYRRIREIVNVVGRAPIMALTATATPKVQHDIQKNLDMMDAVVHKSSFRRPNLYYEVRPKVKAAKEIIRFIKNNPGKSGIVYCLSRKKVEELAEMFAINGIKALPYHAGLDSNTRNRNQDMFLNEEIDVIVATIAFGMGIDKPDVRFVIHYNIPKSLEGYYQETGRAGRDGGEGKCITFYSYDDIQKLEKFMQNKSVSEQEISKQLLYETVSYAESSTCRVRQLLNYFGEEMKEDCGNCDNCLNPKPKFDAKEDVLTVLETILAVKEKFKPEHIVNIIIGKKTADIVTYKHQDLPMFGVGGDDALHWKSVIRQMLIAKLVEKEIVNYGLLKLTPAGQDFMENPKTIMFSKDHDYEEGDSDEAMFSGGTALDNELFSMLKDLRKDVSKKLGVPPFVIFSDPSLQEMATQYPITMDELTTITGVGQGKAQKYGKEFLELIKKHVEENEIERPQDFVVKSAVNKSSNKVFIIKNIDKKMPLEEICNSLGIEMIDLIEEMEAIVNSGTRINIDYYINSVMDEDVVHDIYTYFKEDAESDSIEEALKELEPEGYSEEEIRLIRIKFISEVGN